MGKNNQFPLFRRLGTLNVYYKVISNTECTEYKYMGSKILQFNLVASQYPEILRIQDMIACEMGFVELDSRDFFEVEQAYFNQGNE